MGQPFGPGVCGAVGPAARAVPGCGEMGNFPAACTSAPPICCSAADEEDAAEPGVVATSEHQFLHRSLSGALSLAGKSAADESLDEPVERTEPLHRRAASGKVSLTAELASALFSDFDASAAESMAPDEALDVLPAKDGKALLERIQQAELAKKSLILQLEKEADKPRAFGQWALSNFFLPRKLPGAWSPIADAELLETIFTFTRSPVADTLDIRVRSLILEFCDLHSARKQDRSLAVPSSGNVSTSLHRTQVGGFWAMWVEGQNAVVFVERISEMYAHVSAWQAQIPAEDVLRAVPSWIRIPETVTEVPWSAIAADGFAARLAELAETETLSKRMLDVVNPAFVCDFFVPALGGDPVDISTGYRCISKKTRDECRMRENKRPWRRAPGWLVMKSIMHYACMRAGQHRGRSMYKSLMAKLLASGLLEGEYALQDDSARVEAARKLARRLRKLRGEEDAAEAVSFATRAIEQAMKPVNSRWQDICEQEVSVAIKPTKLKFEKDTVHALTASKNAIEEMLGERPTAKQVFPKLPRVSVRVEPSSKARFAENAQRLKACASMEHDAGVAALFDMERDVMQAWESDKDRWNEEEIKALLPGLNAYIGTAGRVYAADVEGRSRMVLIAVTIVLIIDRCAVSQFPVLGSHQLGIDEEMLTFLLVPGSREKRLLHSIETYIEHRNTTAPASHTGILHPDVHPGAFSVRFAQNSENMRYVLERIQRECYRNQQEKLAEVTKSRKIHEDLMEDGKKFPCKCNEPRKMGHNEHVGPCRRCNQITDANRVAVTFYETYLPADETVQWAVVFDLQMPSLLLCLREAHFRLTEFCSRGTLQKDVSTVGIWHEDPRLRSFCTSGAAKETMIASTSAAISETRSAQMSLKPKVSLGYTSDSPPCKSTLVTAHDTFVVEKERDAVLTVNGKVLSPAPIWSVRDFVRLEVSDPRYESLQFAVDCWEHSENDVIAKKSEAHPELPLREFEAFGCLRAGARLQFPRLARALVQQSLAFERPGVMDLLTALLMQAGPRSPKEGLLGLGTEEVSVGATGSGSASRRRTGGGRRSMAGSAAMAQVLGAGAAPACSEFAPWRRQAHEILGHQEFCDDLCAHATGILHQQASNWTRHPILLAIVHLGICLCHHAPDPGSATKLLLQCRFVACDWIHHVRSAMARASREWLQMLRLKLLDIAATACLTYDAGLLNSPQDASTFVWLRAIISDGLLTGQYAHMSEGDDMDAIRRTTLLRKAHRVALMVEDKLHETFARTDALSDFVRRHWGDATGGECGKWKQHDAPATRWYETTFSGSAGKNTLQVDIIGGSFLVNGAPIGRLPSSITTHEDYVRLFGNATFEVQPALGGGWRTVQGSDVASFFFATPQAGKAPRIVEERRQRDGGRLRAELVSRSVFEKDLPDDLVEKYSHWLVRGANGDACIYFRPARYDDSVFRRGCSRDGAEFVLNMATQKLTQTSSGNNLVDIRSNTFNELYSAVFCRLAPKGQVHVFHSSARGSYVVLPKLGGLKFMVEGSRLFSTEFNSFVVLNQRFGTLIGLQHGLLLQDGVGERVFIVPHAKATREPGTQSITLEVENLRQPPMFAYNLRSDLRSLVGQKDRLAWLYLARLHAITSSPLPDPFLGRMGTSHALHILASGRCRGNLSGSGGWDSQLADTTLGEIGSCSVHREMMTRRSEKSRATRVNYAEKEFLPAHPLPSLCAHEGFAFLVNILRRETSQAATLVGGNPPPYGVSLERATGTLSRRAYLISRELYAWDGRLTPEDEVEVMGKNRAMLNLEPLAYKRQEFRELRGVRAVAQPVLRRRALRRGADVKSLLLSTTKLRGFTSTNWASSPITDWTRMTATGRDERGKWLAHYWLDLYDLARNCHGAARDENLWQFTYLLAFLAQEDGSLSDHLVQLATIAMHAERFGDLEPPKYDHYHEPSEADYSSKALDTMIDKNLSSFTEPPPIMIATAEGEKATKAWQLRKDKHDEDCRSTKIVLSLAAQKAHTECTTLTAKECKQPRVVDPEKCSIQLSALVSRWYKAKHLQDFLGKVVDRLIDLQQGLGTDTWVDYSMNIRGPDESTLTPQMYQIPVAQPESEELMLTDADRDAWLHGYFKAAEGVQLPEPEPVMSDEPLPELPVSQGIEGLAVYEKLLKPLRDGWTTAQSASRMERPAADLKGLRSTILKYLEATQRELRRILATLLKALAPDDDIAKALEISGLWPAPVPAVLLPGMLEQAGHSEGWRMALGSLGVVFRHQQRAKRCLRLLRKGETQTLEQELLNGGCDGWAPCDFPEWLLLEIDNDFCIRGQQAAVARQIISSGKGNRLLQLIMGAGKTAVIVPMVMSSLADGQQCVRVTVLSSLCATNSADWQLKIGGMLNKRVYHLICRREMQVENCSAALMASLEEITRGRHVLVTIPEHRLSLENKALELACNGNVEGSTALHKVLAFFDECGRDILDESDEILHPKFQLVYTLGSPGALDGRTLRWQVVSACLHSVARHADALVSEFGDSALELIQQSGQCDEQFPFVRLLAEAQAEGGAYTRLCRLVADDFLSGLHPKVPIMLRPDEATAWRMSVLDPTTTSSTWKKLSPGLHKVTLILRGLLAHKVLFGALHKRWRVEYGGHPTGRRRMAVPYRAKDVAAERTEFGHPDTALLLTTLHYYYAGLSPGEMREAFLRLSRKGVAESQATFNAWAQGAPTLTVRLWSGVNLDDTEQFDTLLYPTLRRHMHVVDFWLDQVVFPTEAKQFGKKMVSTAWDLCRSDISCVTTGFSGTDDTHLLLPLTIRQSNMVELKETNGALLHNLMRQQNDDYTPLAAGATGEDVLDLVGANPNADVLLDAGALVLELSNKEVSERWLAMREDRKACVYFEGDQTMVVDRAGLCMNLNVSPFERALGECLLYLDDEHTRGTDFRLPLEKHAVVTLGKGLQKDKLMQTVMRMRFLGHGHTVSFVGSFEADLQILEWRDRTTRQTSEDGDLGLENLPAILSWCLGNTVTATCDKLMYYTSQGAIQLLKRHACEKYATDPQEMAKQASQMEVTHLEDLYGRASNPELLPALVTKGLTKTRKALGEKLAKKVELLEKHVADLAPDVRRSAGLFDEEQERELEEEMEQEVEQEVRPDLVEPLEPQISDGLMEFAECGKWPTTSSECIPLGAALGDTPLATLMDQQDWDENVRVTPDFLRTVKAAEHTEMFLRPVTWMLSARGGFRLLISNFEAEEFAAHLVNQRARTHLDLVSPGIRMNQPDVAPSLKHCSELPVSIHFFAGAVHGPEEFLPALRSYLGLCREPGRAMWRELFEKKGAIQSDGFVIPKFRKEVGTKLGVRLDSPFMKSPVALAQGLYAARHMTQDLQASPVGQIINMFAASVDAETLTPQSSQGPAQSPRPPKTPVPSKAAPPSKVATPPKAAPKSGAGPQGARRPPLGV